MWINRRHDRPGWGATPALPPRSPRTRSSRRWQRVQGPRRASTLRRGSLRFRARSGQTRRRGSSAAGVDELSPFPDAITTEMATVRASTNARPRAPPGPLRQPPDPLPPTARPARHTPTSARARTQHTPPARDLNRLHLKTIHDTGLAAAPANLATEAQRLNGYNYVSEGQEFESLRARSQLRRWRRDIQAGPSGEQLIITAWPIGTTDASISPRARSQHPPARSALSQRRSGSNSTTWPHFNPRLGVSPLMPARAGRDTRASPRLGRRGARGSRSRC